MEDSADAANERIRASQVVKIYAPGHTNQSFADVVHAVRKTK